MCESDTESHIPGVPRSVERARDARAIAKIISPVKGLDTVNNRTMIFTRSQSVVSDAMSC
jgi:hypothetical protein